jgi:hypothetical protein
MNNGKETSQTTKVTSTSNSLKQLSTKTIHKKITYPDNSSHEGELVIDLVFVFFLELLFIFQQIHYLFIYLLLII